MYFASINDIKRLNHSQSCPYFLFHLFKLFVDELHDASAFRLQVAQAPEALHPSGIARSSGFRALTKLFFDGLGDELLQRQALGYRDCLGAPESRAGYFNGGFYGSQSKAQDSNSKKSVAARTCDASTVFQA
ncbi:MAG: hypothetical protein ACYDH9_24335 [Limisphaerales bacterium]